MLNDTPVNGHGPKVDGPRADGTTENAGGSTNFAVKAGLAQMLKGGVIMDVVNAEQVYNFLHSLARWPLENSKIIPLPSPLLHRRE